MNNFLSYSLILEKQVAYCNKLHHGMSLSFSSLLLLLLLLLLLFDTVVKVVLCTPFFFVCFPHHPVLDRNKIGTCHVMLAPVE